MYLFIPVFHVSFVSSAISFSCLITDTHTISILLPPPSSSSTFSFSLLSPYLSISGSQLLMSLWVTEERRGFQRKPSTLNLQWKLIIHGRERWRRNSANTQTIAISATPTKVTKPYTNLAVIVCKQQANICVKMTMAQCEMNSSEFDFYTEKQLVLLVFLMALLSTHHG